MSVCLDNPVGVNGVDKAGSTALYWTCGRQHKDTVEALFTEPNRTKQTEGVGRPGFSRRCPERLSRHCCSWKKVRADLRNNRKKLVHTMATNGECAWLLERGRETGLIRILGNA